MPQRLSPDERRALLPELERSGWQADPGADALLKVLKFRDFSQAWGLMSQVALCAERMDHHPDWCNSYNRLQIRLSTHSCGGLSVLDIELARAIDLIAHAGQTLPEGAPLSQLIDPQAGHPGAGPVAGDLLD